MRLLKVQASSKEDRVDYCLSGRYNLPERETAQVTNLESFYWNNAQVSNDTLLQQKFSGYHSPVN